MNDRMTADASPRHPTFGEALKVWARIGLLSFGGPAGQIALMHRELVDERRWISESRFLHALNYCMLLPGPEAQQLATYVGWLLHGARGGIAAGTLFVLPGFLVICVLSSAYALFQDTHWLDALFFGLKAAVLVIVVQALIRIASRTLKTPAARILAALAFLALFAFALPFPLVILLAGVVGYVAARTAPGLLQPQAGHRSHVPDLPSVIGEGVEGGRQTPGRAFLVVAVCCALWIAPFLLLAMVPGHTGAFNAIGVFFSKMAVVTFGGAYAVLAYVAQQAVDTYQWLKPGEMLDGLALAETTPGPLVLVLSFVGFLAAFRDADGLDPLLSGLLGAFLAAWVTFVPCFLWIFLGAPHVERLRGNEALSGALAAISAAVVGVILNLALWFGLHVLFREVGRLEAGPLSMPLPAWSSIDLHALALTIVSAFMLLRLKTGILTALSVSGVLGFLLSWPL
ncbi:chromate efflux transporter [Sinorhizobium sp. BG8]|uniref:chromate efflux transporter n=1 Tax=Sinorhizobium sp. BG8 TaxID=2613773 RepID=UPI00193CF8F1|nr:chromate efflux transporter [Sinorhizobium sp. BG8]QRM56831.1 chromate efflux transporter [Sinorhizobium sp. BG8]